MRVRRFAILVVPVLLVGLFAPTAGVDASHGGTADHEDRPNPTLPGAALCSGALEGVLRYVSGGLDPGVSGHAASHNHYELTATAECVGDADYEGTYVFEWGDAAFSGSGGTDGHELGHAHNSHHGETLDRGWTHCDGYSGGCPSDASNANKGDATVVTAEPTGNRSSSPGVNYVKWFRNGTTHMIVMGALDWNAGAAVKTPFGTVDDCFFAELAFAPTVIDPITGDVTTATVAGDFTIYEPYLTGSSLCG